MKVWLEFDTVAELEAYKQENKHKKWNFLEEYKRNGCCTLIVEKMYGK